MNALKEIQELSVALGIPEVFTLYKARIANLNVDSVRVGIIGGHRSGKTTLLSRLANILLPTTLTSSGSAITVSYGPETLYRIGNGPTTKEYPNLCDADNHETLYAVSPSTWLSSNKLELSEKVESIFQEGNLEIDFYLSDIDICVYILDGLMAFTKNDSMIIDELSKFDIPTVVVLSKQDLLRKNDQMLSSDTANDVRAYLSKIFSNKKHIAFVCGDDAISLDALAPLVQSELDRIFGVFNKDTVRSAQNNLFTVAAIASLYAKCEELKMSIEKKEHQVDTNSQVKRNRLALLEAEWTRIELELTKRRQQCEGHLRDRLEEKKDGIVRKISHELDVSNDIKTYWERDLPYRIDEIMRLELQSLSQTTNNDIVSSLKWLQDELLKTFKKKSFITPSVSFSVEESEMVLDSIELADNKKLKTITKVGTAATVIAAGTLLATSGVAGVVMAISMVSGIGAEWFLGKKTKESREKVKSLLPSIIDQAILTYIDKISVSLRDSYAEIISNLRFSQKQWKEDSLKEIEEEDRIATFNVGREKYEELSKRLDVLSSALLD